MGATIFYRVFKNGRGAFWQLLIKSLVFCFILFLTTLPGFAQGFAGYVKGTVSSREKDYEGMATVSLFRSSDSVLVQSYKTNSVGAFHFPVDAPGKYFIRATAVNYTTYKSPEFSLTPLNPGHDFGNIELLVTLKNLSNVMVTSRRPMIEQKIDRTVINVDAMVTNTGTTALEVLEKSPGISLDADGNIMLKGKQGVFVLVDGRPTQLSGPELLSLLKSLNASQLDQIEIMTNPPARYDASGNAGIVNIKTRKIRQEGMNGNLALSVGSGRFFKANNSASLNFKAGRLNINSSLAWNFLKSYNDLSTLRRLKNSSGHPVASLDQHSYTVFQNESRNFKIALDYSFTKKLFAGITFTKAYNPDASSGEGRNIIRNGQDFVDSVMHTSNRSGNLWNNNMVNVYARQLLDSMGQELSGDLDYATFRSTRGQLNRNDFYSPNGTHTYGNQLAGDLPVQVTIVSGKMDYSKPVSKTLRLESGLKISRVRTQNAALYTSFNNGIEEPDYGKTNEFTYQENIQALYVNINAQVGRFAIQGGVRYEGTNYTGQQFGNPTRTDSSIKNDYASFFPTLFLSYVQSKKHVFGVNLGRRIDRPAFRDLNPFLYFIDQYTYNAGNPFLRPQYTINMEASHSYKSVLVTTFNFSRTNDYIIQTYERTGLASVERKGNLGFKKNMGVATSLQTKVTSWLTSICNINYYVTKFEASLYGERLHQDQGTAMINLTNQLSFKKGWSGEVSGFYRTRLADGQYLFAPIGQLSLGLSKKVLKDRGSFRISLRDVFQTQAPKAKILVPNTDFSLAIRRDTRVANIGFTYRFGKVIKAETRKNGISNKEEVQRVSGG